MRKITQRMIHKFLSCQSATRGNTHTDGTSLFLYGHKIAAHTPEGLKITDAGWPTQTTKERLNGLPGVSIYQKAHRWYLNNQPWDGSWTIIKGLQQ